MYICVLGIFINVYFCIFALSYFFQLGLRALADSGDVSVEAGLRLVRQHWRQLILPRRRSTMPGLPPPPFIFQLKVYCPCLLGLIFKVEVFLPFPLFSYGLSIKLKFWSTSFPRILTHLGEKKITPKLFSSEEKWHKFYLFLVIQCGLSIIFEDMIGRFMSPSWVLTSPKRLAKG